MYNAVAKSGLFLAISDMSSPEVDLSIQIGSDRAELVKQLVVLDDGIVLQRRMIM